MKINWKVRLRNPLFWWQIGFAVLAPILSYMGITGADITTWEALGNVLLTAISNPYVLFLVVVSVANAINDPTTKGVGDSQKALTYINPR